MKVKFCCDSGANIHSLREEVIDTEDFGYTTEQWLALSDNEKQLAAEEWAYERLEIYWDENDTEE